MTGKRIDSAVKIEAMRALQGLNLGPPGVWGLPITFTRDGDTLTGELHIGVRADLMAMGRAQAEEMIRLCIKHAIQTHMIVADAEEPIQ
jgi:hypothetical protein